MAIRTWDEKAVFFGALQRAAGEREDYIRRECCDDSQLARIRTLLSHHASASDNLVSIVDEPRAEREPIGSMFDEFELIKLIGEGAMGAVYLANDTVLARSVALKVLLHSATDRDNADESFKREAQNAGKVKHAGIVPVFRLGRCNGTYYLVSEFVDGETLGAFIERERQERASGRGTPRRAYYQRVAEIVAGVADALEAAHRCDLVHRDVKPTNILLDSQGQPRLTDFGIAKQLSTIDPTKPTTMIVGTPHYMSPEQAAPDRKDASGQRIKIDGRSDVYSLGVVLYELLALQRPFDGESAPEILGAIGEREPTPLRKLDRGIPKDLETICHAAIEKSPAARYQFASQVASELRCFLEDKPILRRPASFWKRGLRFIRKNALASTLTVIGLLATTVAAEESHRWRTTHATVTIRSDGVGEVHARRYALDMQLGEPESIGQLPVVTASLKPGAYRIEITNGDVLRELDAVFEAPDREFTINLPPVTADAPTSCGMALVPAGQYSLGAAGLDTEMDRPRTVNLGAFYIDICPVTNADYKQFIDATGHKQPAHWDRAGYNPDWADFAIVGISWNDMQDYARWVGKRLPTADEWEAAARYPDGRLHPWGNRQPPTAKEPTVADYRLERVTTWDAAVELYRRLARPVWIDTAKSELGLCNMFGNINELTSSTRAEHLDHAVGKGGCWLDTPDTWDLSRATTFLRDQGYMTAGFRCARSVAPAITSTGEHK